VTDNADSPEQRYQPEQTGMYELEFPAPQLSSPDGSGPVMIHALEGFSDAGHAIRLSAQHLKNTLDTELVASFAIDELLDYRSRRPLMTFKTDHFTHYEEPELNLYAMHDSVGTPFSAARRHGAGPALGTVHHRRAAAGRTTRRPPGDRPRHHSDGGAAYPSHHDDGARERQGADRRPHAVGGRSAGAGQRVQPAGIPDGPARPRGGGLHRARSAPIWPRPITPRPPRRCWPRSPGAARCRSRWPS